MSLGQIPRRLLRAPVFTATALLTLAIGIGATTTMFTVVNGVLIKPLAYPDSSALVALNHKAPGLANVNNLSASPTMYFTYREQSRAFAAVGVYTDTGGSVTGLGEPERVTMISTTYGTLDALGVPPALGRVFSQSDDTPGSPETGTVLVAARLAAEYGFTDIDGEAPRPLTLADV